VQSLDTSRVQEYRKEQLIKIIECYESTYTTRVKPDIPTKSYTCVSTSWLLGNVYTAKSCKGGKRVPDALKSGLVS